MAPVKVKVKWGKEVYDDVEAETDEAPIVFKAQLFALTGVQPERQKVLIKGVTLKDEEWGNIKLKAGMMVLMMGSKEEDVPAMPVKPTTFVEDMTENELAQTMDFPAGLTNLGNTCYMNATVQCLRVVPELRESLKRYQGSLVLGGASHSAQSITAALRDLYENMDSDRSTIPPIILLQVLHSAVPRFAEKTENGVFAQQDANECWTELIRFLQQKLPALPPPPGALPAKYSSVIDQYFGGTFEVTLKCEEAEEEQATITTENFLQLSCFISVDVKYMHSGLKSRMSEKITKYSPSLTRDAQYSKTSKILRLPAYLTVQMVRFYYKERESVNAKILKDIKFPMSLDVYDLCAESLQQKLNPMRAKFKAYDDQQVERQRQSKDSEKQQRGALTEVTAGEKTITKYPFQFEDDTGSNNSGFYELQAVLTHRGRSSSSGHYVAWVHKKGDEWMKCDDDNVSLVTSEDVLKLSGGGDWHTAYVLLYGPRILEVEEDSTSMEVTDASVTVPSSAS